MSYVNLNQIEEKEVVPGFFGKFVHTENITSAYWRISAGSSLPEHKHPHEQIVNLLEGTIEFTMNGENTYCSTWHNNYYSIECSAFW